MSETALKKPLEDCLWRELEWIAFDTETTGKYPLSSEICELAAVKWRAGQVVDTYSILLKPSRPMGPEVIAIHGITNSMVENAPKISDKIAEFRSFIDGAVLLAHHAPFDLGFLAVDLENAGLSLPVEPVVCTSLLSRRLFPESPNHRLQTLIDWFSLERGAAHRALDDAKACLQVGLRCLEKLGEVPLSEVLVAQGARIFWPRFSMRAMSSEPVASALVKACLANQEIDMTYNSGSKPGTKRRVVPEGLVRSLDGDFLVAFDVKSRRSKRYYVDQISDVSAPVNDR